MTGKIYRCGVCGSMVQLLVLGDGDLSCCGAPLKPLKQGGMEGFQELREPPIDLLEVVISGKSCWEFSIAEKGPQESKQGRAWEGDSGGLGCF